MIRSNVHGNALYFFSEIQMQLTTRPSLEKRAIDLGLFYTRYVLGLSFKDMLDSVEF